MSKMAPRRQNEYIGKCPIRKAIKAENKKLQNKNIERYLCKCITRMFGEVNPYQRNTGYPFIWH